MPATQPYKCPHCRRPTVIDPARPLNGQRCHLCTALLGNDGKRRLKRSGGKPGFDQAEESPVTGAAADRRLLRLGILVAVLVLLGAGFLGYRRLTAPQDPALGTAQPVALVASPYVDARSLAEQVLAAESPGEFQGLFGKRGALVPEALPLGGRVQSVSPAFFFEGHELQRVNLQTGTGRHRRLYVEKVAGRYLADGPSFLAEGELALPEFLQQRPTKPVLLRVLAAAVTHAVPPFENEAKWCAVHLSSTESPETCYGYLSLEKPALAAVTKRLPKFSEEDSPETRAENEGAAIPLAVRVAFPKEGAGADVVEIVEVVGSGWFIP